MLVACGMEGGCDVHLMQDTNIIIIIIYTTTNNYSTIIIIISMIW